MKKLVALMLGVALLGLVLAPQAEARHHSGTAFAIGALTGALVGAAAVSAYSYPAYSYVYPQPVVVQSTIYHTYPAYQPVYVAPTYISGPYYGLGWGWGYR
jgi:hypothetical protein